MSELKRILAKDTEVGKSYLSRGGREVTIKMKQSDGKVIVLVHLTGNSVVIPPEYELFEPSSENSTVLGSSILEPDTTQKPERASESTSEECPADTTTEREAPTRPKSLHELVKDAPTVRDAIRLILNTGDSYGVDELARLVNASKNTVMLKVSELRRLENMKIVRHDKKYRLVK